MPTARHLTSVLSLQSALVVIGGKNSDNYIDAVEIFKADTSQWYRTDPLPTACRDKSPVVVGNTCYAVGGCKDPFNINEAFYSSVDDLLYNSVPVKETTCRGSSVSTQSAWKTLASTPTYGPVASVLSGKMLAIGGMETSTGGAEKKEVYVYSPSTYSWIYISDLPEPRSSTAVAVLSSTEILVIGGWCGSKVNTTYKGTLSL